MTAKLLSVPEAAARLGCSKWKARQVMLAVKHVRVGKLLRAERDAIDAYVNAPGQALAEGFAQRHGHGERVTAKRKANGFTAELVAWLRSFQAGHCAICPALLTSRGMTMECGDHCHQTGQARGLLCAACNYSLGNYEKHQRPAGLRIEAYERYLASPPAHGSRRRRTRAERLGPGI